MNRNSTPAAQQPSRAAVVVDHLYVQRPGSDAKDAFDRLSSVLRHLHAQLATTCGGGFQNFSEHSEEIQDAFLFGCASQAQECLDLCRALEPGLFAREVH